MRRRNETTEKIGEGLRELLLASGPLPAEMQALLLRLAAEEAEQMPVPHRAST